ncbi:MAG: hypothetical protein GC164_10515 [Phycisphaera sp.]|nr:hypothetical protein [Phycisphaera sp.]
MRIGVDFDNTIVCYDELFYRLGLEMGLIPASVGKGKQAIRDYIRSNNAEEHWIELQGMAYGSYILQASPFEGCLEVLRRLVVSDIDVILVSHKTLYPHRGPRVRLHDAARGWLRHHGFLSDKGGPFTQDSIWFEVTRDEKIARIAQQRCDIFIDDLPEFLGEPSFPKGVRRVLFDALGSHEGAAFLRLERWSDLPTLIAPLKGVA